MNKLGIFSFFVIFLISLINSTYADDILLPEPIFESSISTSTPLIFNENIDSVLTSSTTDLVGTTTDDTNTEPTTTLDFFQTDIVNDVQNIEEKVSTDLPVLNNEIVEPILGKVISGTIEEDQVWTKEEGPYYVDNIYIPEGVTVTIKPGTEVFVGDYIAVFGNLFVEGNVGDNVSLRFNYDFASWYIFVGDTGKVDASGTNLFETDGVFVNQGALHFDGVSYLDATDGILLQNGASFSANNLTISGLSRGTAVTSLTGSMADISKSVIEGGSGDYIIAGYQNGNIHISNSTIIPTDGVPIIMVGGNLTLDDVVMEDGNKGGIELYPYNNGVITRAHVNISNSTISGFAEQGIFGIDPNLQIVQSTISGNDVGIETYEQNNFFINIASSIISDNTTGVIFGVTNPSGESVFDARNNFWGEKSGPYEERNLEGLGDSIVTYHADETHFVDFSPWLKIPPGKKHNPVIIIPGIMSSYLNHKDGKDTEVWPSVNKIILFPKDKLLDDLILSNTGILDHNNDLFAKDILREVGVLGHETDFFKSFISNLEDNGYVEGQDLFVFPYDWRLDVEDIVDGTPNSLNMSLKEKIEAILLQTKSEKVDIVAHSMGGLLAEYYIKNYGKNKIDKFIDIATPHLGAPKALKVLVYGDDMDIKFGPAGLNNDEIKKISQNFPSAYNLLPSSNYFSSTLPDYKYYFYDIGDVNGDGIVGRHDFSQTTSFLKNTGRNSLLLENAARLHSDLDNFDPSEYGIDSYNIIGCGAPTIGKIFAEGNKTPQDTHYDIAYINGDGTVPERSAEYFKTDKVFYANNVVHATMPSDPGVANLVLSILDNDTDNFNYLSNPNIAQSTVNCELPDGDYISIHSPVALHIYDVTGRHTGPDKNGEIEYGIPGITYDVLEDNKFVFLPNTISGIVKIVATGVGSADVFIKKFHEGRIIRTEYFGDVPVSSLHTKGQIFSEEEGSKIIMEEGGVQKVILPSSRVLSDSFDDLVPPETKISKVSGLNILGKYMENPVITFDVFDEGSGVLRTEYSIDNEESWYEVLGDLEIKQRGPNRLFYRSVDKVGNIEKSKFIDFDIDTGERGVILNNQNRGGRIVDTSLISTSTLFAFQKSTGAVLGLTFDKVKSDQNTAATSNLKIKDLKLKSNDILSRASVYENRIFKNMFSYVYQIYLSLVYKIIDYFK